MTMKKVSNNFATRFAYPTSLQLDSRFVGHVRYGTAHAYATRPEQTTLSTTLYYIHVDFGTMQSQVQSSRGVTEWRTRN
eukprot:1516287-Amphidinium_carterae.1